MKIIAHSQAPAELSYIHLSYISAQLNNRISKGELMSGQAVLGMAVATAILCGAIGAKLAREGRGGRAAQIGGVLGFIAALGLLWLAHAAWSETRSNEEAIEHIIETKQFWALRDSRVAAGIEAAATTNGAAASLAADYYGLKGGNGKEAPEFVVGPSIIERAASAVGSI